MKIKKFSEVVERLKLREDIKEATGIMEAEMMEDRRDDEIIVYVPTKIRIRDNKHIVLQENVSLSPYLDIVRRGR